MLTFAHAWIFWLTLLPVAVWFLLPPRQRGRSALRVPFLSRLQDSHPNSGAVQRRVAGSLLLLAVGWILVVAALARPQWLEPPITRTIPTRDLLMIVDLSASMEQEDFTSLDGEFVDRLTAVKEVMGDFLTQREGDRVGLVVFGNSPFLQVPFTTDLELCRQLLDQSDVGMAGPRTALGDAIGLGIGLFDDSTAPAKTIIALTDGNDTGSSVPPVEASRIARDRDITIHTIAVGDPTTVGEEAIDQQALKEVAENTNGEFFLALNRAELTDIYDSLDKIETREVKTVSHRPRRDLFFWPLGLALLVSLSSNVVRVLVARRAEVSVPKTRLRVNARTFELETVQLRSVDQ